MNLTVDEWRLEKEKEKTGEFCWCIRVKFNVFEVKEKIHWCSHDNDELHWKKGNRKRVKTNNKLDFFLFTVKSQRAFNHIGGNDAPRQAILLFSFLFKCIQISRHQNSPFILAFRFFFLMRVYSPHNSISSSFLRLQFSQKICRSSISHSPK